jgi:hypothetical protein
LGEQIFSHPSEFYPPLALNKTNSDDIAIGGQILYLDHSRGKDNWPERINLGLDTNTKTPINYVNSGLIYVGTNNGIVFSITRVANNWKIRRIQAHPFPKDRYLWHVQTLSNDEKKISYLYRGLIRATYSEERFNMMAAHNGPILEDLKMGKVNFQIILLMQLWLAITIQI